MYRMDNRLIKQKIFDKCLSTQLEHIQNIEFAMNDAQKSANEYGQGADLFDSNKMQMIGKRDMYANQLKTETNLLEVLNKVDLSVKHDKVEFGAVVITNLQKVFISIGLGKIVIENEEFYSISLKVPFYEAMAGLKAGDKFNFRGKDIQIVNIY